MSNTQKLTAAMVAAYSNAKVREIGTGEIYDLAGVWLKQNELTLMVGDMSAWVMSASRFQLVLTSPHNVSDEQALEVAMKYWNNNEDFANAEKIKELICELAYDSADWRSSSVMLLSDICRSLSIDMGYMGIESLITAGLAVEAGMSV